MKKSILTSFTILLVNFVFAQVTGDTIKVKTFHYASNTRDTLINFPNGSNTYEKIIMKYNMRCKDALISTASQRDLGCGEWDYSCNTYIVDSSKIEEELNKHPNYVISNFSGSTFNYTNQPVYNFYDYAQSNITINSIVSENQFAIGNGSVAVSNLLKANQKSGKSQMLYTASELLNAGFSAGNIDGLMLDVANAGAGVNFFKVKLKQITASVLNAASVNLTGLTEVYNSNYNFVNGSNRIQFTAPFVWDGTSNVLIELSFTNTVPTSPVVFNGTTESSFMSLYANNNYSLDLSSSGHVNIDATYLTAISTEISISFWAYGDASVMPVNNSILYGWANNPDERNLNIHLPWGNGTVYFDCGYANGGFDRINKTSVAANQGGQWNHWTFTKKTGSSIMKVYLNGAMFVQVGGKTRTISLLNLILGKDHNLQNNYKGKVNEFTIWNKELSLANIQAWMNKPITAAHPDYAYLLAYYKMDEGTGLVINDSKNLVSSTGVNVLWSYERGDKLTRMFVESNDRPNITFLRGTYNQTVTTVTVRDSVVVNPHVIEQYSITSNSGVIPFQHDVVNLINTSTYYEATNQNIYDGQTGAVIGTIPTTPQGSISIFDLDYYKRYPFYNEIMSFVTPYGIGLDLGLNGKSWYYDVTDFAPILKDSKRIVMTLGGQRQEQMDVEFWFIVGTPPRNVLEFNQLWQGAGRAGDASIGSINTNTRFQPLTIPVLNSGQAFKLRSTITGHGAEGEFEQNGGVINHLFNINGGANEYSWRNTMLCGFNPIFPQGGTWVYDRQGWCPGKASLLKEFNVTSYLTPGTNAIFDYNCSTPPVSGGDYRYIAAHQLVTYGAANHSLDANVIEVLSPTNRIYYGRTNPICANPTVLVQNTGSTTITNLEIEYWLNNASTKQVYNWTGSLNYMDTISIVLPTATLWQNDFQTSGNVFHVNLKKANTVVDDYSYNNVFASPFEVSAVIPSAFTLEFKTNNDPSQNTFKIVDENGNIVDQSNFTTANTVYTSTYNLNGCYKLIVEDVDGDGLSWWANTAQGNGFVRIKNTNLGTVFKTFEPDFGSRFEFSFTTDVTLGLANNDLASSISLYPNPAKSKFVVEGAEISNASYKLVNILGELVIVPMNKQNNKAEFDSSSLSSGIYMLEIEVNGKRATKKIVVE